MCIGRERKGGGGVEKQRRQRRSEEVSMPSLKIRSMYAIFYFFTFQLHGFLYANFRTVFA